jgi:hypothetical protein
MNKCEIERSSAWSVSSTMMRNKESSWNFLNHCSKLSAPRIVKNVRRRVGRFGNFYVAENACD